MDKWPNKLFLKDKFQKYKKNMLKKMCKFDKVKYSFDMNIQPKQGSIHQDKKVSTFVKL